MTVFRHCILIRTKTSAVRTGAPHMWASQINWSLTRSATLIFSSTSLDRYQSIPNRLRRSPLAQSTTVYILFNSFISHHILKEVNCDVSTTRLFPRTKLNLLSPTECPRPRCSAHHTKSNHSLIPRPLPTIFSPYFRSIYRNRTFS